MDFKLIFVISLRVFDNFEALWVQILIIQTLITPFKANRIRFKWENPFHFKKFAKERFQNQFKQKNPTK